jgi:hypothetical protein
MLVREKLYIIRLVESTGKENPEFIPPLLQRRALER